MESTLDLITKNVNENQRDIYKKLFYNAIREIKYCTDTVDDIEFQFKYKPGYHLFKPVYHIGQRKLFLSEFRFLTEIYNDEEIIVVYAGAAPGNHTGLLSQYFPKIKFVLIDPNDFKIIRLGESNMIEIVASENLPGFIETEDYNIFIIQDYFTLNMARLLSTLETPTYFISDIRTNFNSTHSNKDGSPTDLDVVWNLSQQFNWLCELKPKAAMFKFRHPYYEKDLINHFKKHCADNPYSQDFAKSIENGINFVDNYLNKKLVYPKGKLHIQPCSGHLRLLSYFWNLS